MTYVGKSPADIIATAVDTTTGTFSGDLTVDTNTLYVDSANNRVGVGTGSPTTLLTLQPATNTDSSIHFGTANYGVQFGTKMYTQSKNEAGTISSFYITNKVTSSVNGRTDVQQHLSHIGSAAAQDYQYWSTGGSERMRIDGSGNLLVGKTSSGIGTAGIELRSNNDVLITSNGSQALYLNRLSSDGTIAEFRKDGTAAGSIGVDSTDLYIAGTTHGLKFDSIDASTMYIRPVNNSGSNVTGQIDLGQAGNVFRDAYVSGGVYFAPNAYPANYLDDYEEGTYEPTFTGGTSGSLTPNASYKTLSYTKIGRLVFVGGRIRPLTGTIVGTLSISLPFTSASMTEEADYSSGSVLIRDLNVPTGAYDANVYVPQNSSTFNIYISIDNGVWHDVDGNDSPQSAYYQFGFSYLTDS